MASENEGHKGSRSTSQEGDRTDEESVAISDDEAPKEGKHQDNEDSDIIVPDSDDEECQYTSSDVEGSTSQGSHHSSESKDELPTCTTVNTKKDIKNCYSKGG